MNDWVYYILLLAAMLASLFLALVQLPGIWLLLAAAGAYAWATGGAYIGWITLAILLAIAAAAEVLESFAAAHGAGRAGASRRAMLLSIIGAIVGGLTFTAIPIPIVGTLFGVCLGAFMGAVLGEMHKGKGREQWVKSGLGAAIGRLAGTLIKLGLGAVMLLIAAIAAIPRSSPLPPSPTAGPASVPTTLQAEQ